MISPCGLIRHWTFDTRRSAPGLSNHKFRSFPKVQCRMSNVENLASFLQLSIAGKDSSVMAKRFSLLQRAATSLANALTRRVKRKPSDSAKETAGDGNGSA